MNHYKLQLHTPEKRTAKTTKKEKIFKNSLSRRKKSDRNLLSHQFWGLAVTFFWWESINKIVNLKMFNYGRHPPEISRKKG